MLKDAVAFNDCILHLRESFVNTFSKIFFANVFSTLDKIINLMYSFAVSNDVHFHASAFAGNGRFFYFLFPVKRRRKEKERRKKWVKK